MIDHKGAYNMPINSIGELESYLWLLDFSLPFMMANRHAEYLEIFSEQNGQVKYYKVEIKYAVYMAKNGL